MKVISGHQPAYLPWLGYFHKLYLSDVFVYMDTVQYLDADWNNRNKIRTPQGWSWLTVPIDRKLSTGPMLDQMVIKQSDATDGKQFWQRQHWNSLYSNYAKAPFFRNYSDELEEIYLGTVWSNLVDLCWLQFRIICKWLSLDDIQIVRMSEYKFDGKKDDLVLDHCIKLRGNAVVFGEKGRDYVDLEKFKRHHIQVSFQHYRHPLYKQRFPGFETHMCILDLIFNHGPNSMQVLLDNNLSREELRKGMSWEVVN